MVFREHTIISHYFVQVMSNNENNLEKYCIIKVDKSISINSILLIFIIIAIFFSSSFLLLQRVPHALHHFSLREVKPLPSFGHFLINERAKRYCREIIVYSRSIINAYSPLSHKWWVLLIKFMVGPTIHVREVNMHLWYSESI